MGKNNSLPKRRNFRNHLVFKEHIMSLLKLLYSREEISENSVVFINKELIGISAIIHPYHLYIDLNEEYINSHPIFRENYTHKFEAINTTFDYKSSSKRVYLYPRDRDEFPDTPLGMEQRAAFFMVVLQVALEQIHTLNN